MREFTGSVHTLTKEPSISMNLAGDDTPKVDGILKGASIIHEAALPLYLIVKNKYYPLFSLPPFIRRMVLLTGSQA